MADARNTMMDPPIEQLLETVDSKFTLVTLAAKRGRQINSYFNQLGEGLGAIVPPQVASIARKPLSIALEEIAAGKVQAGEAPEPEDVVDDAEANEPFGAVGADIEEMPPSATVAELVLGARTEQDTEAGASTPDEVAPVEDAAAGVAPVEDAAAGVAPVEDAAAGVAPVEDAAVTPVEDAGAGVAPVEDAGDATAVEDAGEPQP